MITLLEVSDNINTLFFTLLILMICYFRKHNATITNVFSRNQVHMSKPRILNGVIQINVYKNNYLII